MRLVALSGLSGMVSDSAAPAGGRTVKAGGSTAVAGSTMGPRKRKASSEALVNDVPPKGPAQPRSAPAQSAGSRRTISLNGTSLPSSALLVTGQPSPSTVPEDDGCA